MTACRPGPDIRAIIWSPAGRNRPTVNPDGVTGRRSRMDKEELLLRYECDGGEELYAEAKPRFEEALAENPGDARLLNAYGYLLECHGRRMIREAAGYYQQAIDADPGWAKPRFQQIGALSALQDAYELIPRYEARLAASPDDATAYHLLALAYLHDHDHAGAARVIGAGLKRFPADPGLIEQLGRLAEAAREWRVIIGWCEAHDATIEAAWPRHELQRVEAALGAR